jgi:hypothetical protein
MAVATAHDTAPATAAREAFDVRAVLGVWALWLAGTAGVLAVAVATGAIASGPHHGMPGVVRDGPLWPLRSWDFAWYRQIADHGYPAGRVSKEDAFFPLWPALLAALRPLGSSLAGAVVAVPASALAFLGVARLAPQPRRAAVALACLPGSFALLLLYPDGLALAAAAGGCVLATRNRAVPAGLLAAVAAVARPNGFLVAIPLAVLLWRRRGAGPAVAAASLPVIAAAAVHAYLWRHTGHLLAFRDAQRAWGRDGPTGLVTSVLDVPSTHHVQTLVELALAVVAVGLCAWLFRHGQASPWGWFAAAVLALSLLSGSYQSIGRQALFAFPLAFAAAGFARGRERLLIPLGIAVNVGLILALPFMAP